MCFVSFVGDYGRERIRPEQWTVPTFNEYKEILEKLKELDKKLDQPHCEDANKIEWMKSVEDRLNKLEKKPKGANSTKRKNK